MTRKVSVSDIIPKQKCKEYLEIKGYHEVMFGGRDDGYDILAKKDSNNYFFEIKYSSKETGKYFGTVMLTELYKAITNRQYYFFILCRGNKNEDIKNWFFKIFSVDEFLRFCTLTTPIFHYHIYVIDGTIKRAKYRKETIEASDNLILKMWKEFQNWKNKKNEN